MTKCEKQLVSSELPENKGEGKSGENSHYSFTGKYPIGYKFVKTFGKLGCFVGEVKSLDPPFYQVYYEDDGDKEDLSEGELSTWPELTMSGTEKKKTKKQQSKKEDMAFLRTRLQRCAAMKVINYFEQSDDEEERESHFDTNLTVNSKGKIAKSQPKSKRAGHGRDNSSEDEYDVENEASSDESLDLDSEYDRESKEGPQPHKKKPASAKDKAPQGTTKMKMCDMFQPFNTPTYMKLSLKEIYEQKEFLDPCGIEGTDDIIDCIVGEQVDQIGSLLE
jgi:hypothetical protein